MLPPPMPRRPSTVLRFVSNNRAFAVFVGGCIALATLCAMRP